MLRTRLLQFFTIAVAFHLFRKRVACISACTYNSSHPYGRTAMFFTLGTDMLHTHNSPQLSLLGYMEAVEVARACITLRMSSLEKQAAFYYCSEQHAFEVFWRCITKFSV